MSTERLDKSLRQELDAMYENGRAKAPERVISGYIAPSGHRGPRYTIEGETLEFLRMNSNSYLSLSHHPTMIHAADEATRSCGVGPGAVRFIDGTFTYHRKLEERIAQFTGKPAARIFNSAYTANCGLAFAIGSKTTYWIGDQLNHNSIIRAMRIAGVEGSNKAIYAHNSMEDLQRCIEEVRDDIDRVVVIFDGIFSMRGDYAPIDRIKEIADRYRDRFRDGIITVVDDSHGIGAFGENGRGTPEFTSATPDIIVGTFGKAFGVNGGFIAASETVVEAVRQKADTYIYTNPLSVADCAAAEKALDICDSDEGRKLLAGLHRQTKQFRDGLRELQLESIDGPHPVVPLMVRDTRKTVQLVKDLFARGVLVVGITFPVVPRGDESIRFQINAAHTESDIGEVLDILAQLLQ